MQDYGENDRDIGCGEFEFCLVRVSDLALL